MKASAQRLAAIKLKRQSISLTPVVDKGLELDVIEVGYPAFAFGDRFHRLVSFSHYLLARML